MLRFIQNQFDEGNFMVAAVTLEITPKDNLCLLNGANVCNLILLTVRG